MRYYNATFITMESIVDFQYKSKEGTTIVLSIIEHVDAADPRSMIGGYSCEVMLCHDSYDVRTTERMSRCGSKEYVEL